MKKHIKIISRSIFLICILLIILIYIIYNDHPRENLNNSQSSNWTSFIPVPFSGYVCGYSDSRTFLQLPFFIQKNCDIDLSSIVKISLIGSDDVIMDCYNYQISSYKDVKNLNVKLGTLSFRVELQSEGDYILNSIIIDLDSGEKVIKKLDNLVVKVIENNFSADGLEMREFIINQSQSDFFKVSYYNNTSQYIEITDISFPVERYSNVEIAKYKDFTLKEKESDLLVPPYEERTFTFTFTLTEEYSQKDHYFFYMLPLISYTLDEKMIVTPSQTQATIVQTAFKDEYIKDLIK